MHPSDSTAAVEGYLARLSRRCVLLWILGLVGIGIAGWLVAVGEQGVGEVWPAVLAAPALVVAGSWFGAVWLGRKQARIRAVFARGGKSAGTLVFERTEWSESTDYEGLLEVGGGESGRWALHFLSPDFDTAALEAGPAPVTVYLVPGSGQPEIVQTATGFLFVSAAETQ